MKSRLLTITSFTAVALALVVGIAFAQAEGHAPGMHHGMRPGFMGGGPEFGMFLHQLNLTDDQKAQVKQIFQSEKPNIKPLMQQEMQTRLQMMQLITSGTFDQAKATVIANQAAQTHAQLEVEHAKIGSQIYALLDSTQKAKVADIIAKHQQHMQDHLDKQGPPEEQ